MAEQLADGRTVGVELEIPGKVIGDPVVRPSSPASTICITWAATTDLVMLAIAN